MKRHSPRVGLAATLALTSSLIAPPSGASCPDMLVRTNDRYAVGFGPASIAIGDLNGDGYADLVTASRMATDVNTISVLLGNGNGGFRNAVNYAVGLSTRQVAIGDIDGDGIPDVVVAKTTKSPVPGGCVGNPSTPVCSSDDANTVTVLRGNGDGTLAAPFNIAAGNGPTALALSDYNGDGIKDIAVTDELSNTVSILISSGGGSFLPAAQYQVGTRPEGVVATDMNGDRLPDLAVANITSRDVSILIARPGGTFVPGPTLPSGANPEGIAAADFNGDGISDLAVATQTSTIYIYRGRGDATFASPVTLSVAASSIRTVRAADINSDNKMDIVVAGALDGLFVVPGHGDGTFGEPTWYAVGLINDIGTADFDLDGDADLAAADGGADTATVLLNQGDGSFQNWGGGGSPRAIAAGDFNGDGRQDLAVANQRQVALLLGDGTGTFGPTLRYSTSGSPIFVIARDFNRDSKLDLAVLFTYSALGDGVAIFLGRGDGTFAVPTNYYVGSVGQSFAAADMNADSVLDLIVPADRSIVVIPGNSDGTFNTSAATRTSVTGDAWSAVAGDFNGDSRSDVAVVEREARITVMLGRGDGTFGTSATYLAGTSPWSVTSGDFNRDGHLDLASCAFSTGDVTILLGSAAGTFTTGARYASGKRPRSVLAADITGDGIADLTVANSESLTVSLFVGKGDGSFESPAYFAQLAAPCHVQSADFDNDGKTDVVIATEHAALPLLLNRCNAVMQVFSLSPASGPSSGGQTVLIRGMNLGGTTSVGFGGASATITSRYSTSVSSMTPPHAAGTVDVVVGASSGTTTMTARYTYFAEPIINTVAPPAGPAAGGQTITLLGANLLNTTSVTFGGTPATILQTASSWIKVTVPAHGPGAVDIVAATPAGQAVLAGGYTYRATAAAIPAMTDVILVFLAVLLVAVGSLRVRT